MRLIVFGCSLTYGHGLPDCFDPPTNPGQSPSTLGWPNILAQHLGRTCINNALPGESNKAIWNSIINFKYRSTDMVFVLWSYPERTAIITRTHIQTIGTWNNPEYYESVYDSYDADIMSKLFINHANLFLRAKNIKVYNMVIRKEYTNLLTLKNSKVENFIPAYIGSLREKYPMALDNSHPGLECQLAFTKEILNYLKIDNNIIKPKTIGIIERIKRMRYYMKTMP